MTPQQRRQKIDEAIKELRSRAKAFKEIKDLYGKSV